MVESEILFVAATKWMKPVSHGLGSDRALEGQKPLVSTVCFKCSWGFFPTLLRGRRLWEEWPVNCRRQRCGSREWAATRCLTSSQLLAWPTATARVTFTSICAEQGILISPDRWRCACAGASTPDSGGARIRGFFPSPRGGWKHVHCSRVLICVVSWLRFCTIPRFPYVPSSLPARFQSAAPSLDCRCLLSTRALSLFERCHSC